LIIILKRTIKCLQVGLACAVALLALQVLSYFLLAPTGISAIALRLTPEHTHFVEGTSFSWALLNLDGCENLTDGQKRALLSGFQRRYQNVYTNDSQLPENAQHRDASGRRIGFKEGFSFSLSIVSRGPFWVRVRHQDWEGNQAASGGETVFVWILGVWVKASSGRMAVA